MKIWIDAMTGTWGDVEEPYILTMPGPEIGLGEMSDNQRSRYAMQKGLRVVKMVE